MKIKMIAACSLVATVAVFSSCSISTNKTVEDVNANSDFVVGLLTPIEEADFSGYGIIPGFGVTGYYDKKYGDWEADMDAVSACYVRYDVTAYPDYMSGEQYVTGISVTDPEISVYGYSVGDDSETYKTFLQEKGFKLYEDDLQIKRLEKDKVKLRYSVNPETQSITSIAVEVDVTNQCGVVF